MDQLKSMQIFVAVAESKGFAAAARRLDLSPPAVTRAIAELEAHLGVQLLQRTTRSVRTTDVGEQYLADVRIVIAAAQAANESVTGVLEEPKGRLTVTASRMFGRMYVTPVIVEYLKHYPQVNVSAMFIDRVVDLIDEGIDVGVRIGQLPDSSLRARRLGFCRLIVCATKAYLKKNGTPKTPDDLHDHTLINSTAGSRTTGWKFEFPKQSNRKRRALDARLTVSSNEAAIEAVRSGFGLTRLLSYQVAPYIESGELITVLEDYEPEPLPIQLVHRADHGATAALRLFNELMIERIGSEQQTLPS